MQAQEALPPPTPAPVAPPVQEIPIRPLVVRLPPERTVERTIVEQPAERRTEPLPIVNIEVPAPAAPHVTVVVPPAQSERTMHEPNTVVPEQAAPTHDTSSPETERTTEPVPEVPPVSPATELPPILPPAGSSEQPEPEVAQPEVPKSTTSERARPEENSSEPELPVEEKTSGRKKLKVYNGEGGRIHNDKQIDEILDWYLQTAELPDYVSDRQRYSYRHHRRLLERRKLLEQRGVQIIIHEVGRQQ